MNNDLPPYVFLPTGLFLAKLIAHKEGEDRSRWVTDFAVQLVEGAGCDNFARSLIDTAVIKQNAAMNRVRRSRAKSELISEGVKNPTRQQIEERLKEIYAEEEITAAATTREGVDVVHDRESGSLGRATTGCNISQVAPTRKAGDESSDTGNGAALKSATACNQLTADAPHREAGEDITCTGNRDKLESGTSANNYDQETEISTNSPDASSGNAEGVNINGTPITRNGSRAACTSATSWQTISKKETLDTAEALDNTCEGGTPGIERESASLPSHTPAKTDPKPTRKAKAEVKPVEQKYPHGEFGNIMLTTDEYVKLCERLDNADDLIAEADGYFEAQPDKKRKYKSHYAMLLNWDRRRKEFEGVKPRKFKTAVDQDREEIKWLSDYYAKKERGENPPLPKIKMVGSA